MMKLLYAIITLFVLATAGLSQTPQQQSASPQRKLIQFQMAILKRGPKWTPNPGKDFPAVQKQHVDYVQSLLASNKAVIAGAIKDESDLVGVYIFRTTSADEARSWIDADPGVIGGLVTAELHPWWSEDVMKKTETPTKLMTAYLAFLVRGEKWTPETTPQSEEIQKGHMANISRLAEMKKLVVAGPFGDDGTLRGIFVFRVDSMEEARTLTMTDPAVKAGRLALDLHPWLVPVGILP
ncbi:MAG: hypothetical protein DMF69_04200 [Acidobacteria bacterium]|nr:MAG: hypothetical protein DMF69_04200 [Acidobacteriota bacterium]